MLGQLSQGKSFNSLYESITRVPGFKYSDISIEYEQTTKTSLLFLYRAFKKPVLSSKSEWAGNEMRPSISTQGVNCIQPQRRHATLAALSPQTLQPWIRAAFHLLRMFFISRFRGSRGHKTVFQPLLCLGLQPLHVCCVCYGCSPVELMGTEGLSHLAHGHLAV